MAATSNARSTRIFSSGVSVVRFIRRDQLVEDRTQLRFGLRVDAVFVSASSPSVSATTFGLVHDERLHSARGVCSSASRPA